MRLSSVFAAFLLVGCGEADATVTQVGYFKSSVNDRIFTARLSSDASEEDARIFGESRPHTAGQMTAVYIYENEAVIPADGVTLANSVFEVNDVLELPNVSSWRFVYM
jgi:hypothetical protein